MTSIKNFNLLLGSALLIITSCKKKDAPATIPTLTTSAVTNITVSTATGGGTITSNGGANIMASGICWSKTNATPTIADDTTKGTTASGTFTANLRNITPSATWYVRAYATNSAGTGYGNIVSFTTGNGTPEARNLTVTGTVQVAERITAAYSYFDFENDPESSTTYQWYRANDAAGTGEVAIAGAITLIYLLQATDEFKYIRIGVTAKSSSGTSPGNEVKSAFVGPVAAPATTVTFTYNGASVTYGILVSPVTGRRWLDRNLGAPNAATSVTDFVNYGDLLQWGRGLDGHQLITRGPTTATTTGVNGTTTTLSSTNVPGHNLFIVTNNTPPNDWRSPQNANLWQGVNGVNNPCPAGWRLATETEWTAENITNSTVGHTQLKLTYGGFRSQVNGVPSATTAFGHYWSSTPATDFPFASRKFQITSATGAVSSSDRANGMLCRCIKD